MTRDTTDAAATATVTRTTITTTTTLGLNLPSALTAHLSALTRRIYGLPSSSSTLPVSSSTPAATALSTNASAITSATSSTTDPLAEEVAHNLEYQHDWNDVSAFSSSTDAQAHAPTTANVVTTHNTTQRRHPARTILIGTPPTRLYVHPDQQILELSQEKTKLEQEKKKVERVYVVPTRRTESLSLVEITAIFDRIPPPTLPPSLSSSSTASKMTMASAGQAIEASGNEKASTGEKEWERVKRVLLAVVDDDSTIAYYILHDGIVKPRQN